MKLVLSLHRRLAWFNLPAALLVALLQRTPVVRVASSAGEYVSASSVGAVLKAAVALLGSLGAVHSLAGATTLSATSVSPASATVGTAKSIAFSVLGTQSPAASWTIAGSLPPGLTFNGGATLGIINISSGFLTLSGTPTTAGNYTFSLRAWENTNGKGNVSPTFSYAVNVAAAAATTPNFTTQPQSQTVTAGSSVTFNSNASGTPLPTYQWRKDGGAISGATNISFTLAAVQLTDAAVYTVVATNTSGSTTSNAATLTVNAANAAPAVVTPPTSQTVTVGQSVTFAVVASGTPSPTFQWRKDGAVIAGATAATLTLSAVQLSDAASYTVAIANSAGSIVGGPATLTVSPRAAAAPTITAQPPAGLNLIVGQSLALNVGAEGAGLSYQWRRITNAGTLALPGATNAAFTVKPVAAGDGGTYFCTVSNTAGSAESAGVVVTVASASANPGRLINLSVLTGLAAAGDDFSLGYVVTGATAANTKPLVIRAAGPSLGALGVSGTLSDPKMELFAGSTKTNENDNWGGVPSISSAMSAVGAFPYAGAASLDSAVVANINSRDNSVKISAGATAPAAVGTVIGEVYDATTTAAYDATTTPRLVNLSVLKNVGTSLTMGFVIGGATGKTMLVRAIGPTLGSVFGLPGTMSDPKIELFDATGKSLATNDNWGGTAALTGAFGDTGAFVLPASSADAALLITLAPGNYTAQVTVATGVTGVSLVEVYEVP